MSGRRWTDEEKEFLREKWGCLTRERIAKKIGRTPLSVSQMATKLKLGPWKDNTNMLKVKDLVAALGYTVYGNSYLIFRFKKLGCPIVYRKRIMFINIDSFWEWAEENKKELNFAKFKNGALGKEPNWVEEKRKADMLNPANKRTNRIWTPEEDRLLIAKVKSNKYTYRMLSNDFNRTDAAIKRRLNKLNVPYRPIPSDNLGEWSKEEKEKAISLRKKDIVLFL